VKAIATLTVAALAYWGLQVVPELSAANWTMSSALTLLAGLLVVGLGYYWIMVSRTGIDGTHIRQTWMWRKQVALADIAHIKFVYVPGMAWLVAPRLVVRARGRGVVVFHVADKRVLAKFVHLSLKPPEA
jgi:hypothetical protein